VKPIVRILLIEDDAVDRMAITGMATKNRLPYEFEHAATIADARRLLTSRSYDLILSDYKLPDGTSFDLLDLFVDKLVIITTGGGDEATAARALQLGVRDYLIKDPERGYLTLLPYRIEIALSQWRAELALRESEQRYRDLVENATDMIQSVSPDGTVLFVNRAWLNALNYTEADILGKNIFDVIHPDCRAQCVDLFRRVLRGEVITKLEAVFVTKDGRSIQVEGNANCQFHNGMPVCTRGILRDISERKRREAERELMITELKSALEEVRLLSGLLPICAWCKKVRDDSGYWEEVSAFFRRRAKVKFTHGMCPECEASLSTGMDQIHAEGPDQTTPSLAQPPPSTPNASAPPPDR